MKFSWRRIKSPWVALVLILTALATFTALAPVEKTLMANARIVYLHGAWVWAALSAFLLAAFTGIWGLLRHSTRFHRWSRALGRTGITLWITYLPLSMWAMQTSWNGLFLAEPRWRFAITFAISGLLLQIGVGLLETPFWASLVNIFYILALFASLSQIQNVMHPPSPMLDSNAPRIQLFFGWLVLLALLAAWQIARAWLQLDRHQRTTLSR